MWAFVSNWITITVVVPVIIGIGWGALSMNPPEHIIAQVSFSLAAIILLIRTGWWMAFEQHGSIPQLTLFSFIIFGIIGSLWLVSIRWVRGREHKPLTTTSINITKQLQGPKDLTTVRIQDKNEIEYNRRIELYKNFIKEKTRRIHLYSEGLFLCFEIGFLIANQKKLKPKSIIDLNQKLNDSINKYEQWTKEKNEEDAIFIGLIEDIKIHFRESAHLSDLLKLVSEQILVKAVEEPSQTDFQDQDHIKKLSDRAGSSINKYVDTKIRHPLDDLANYLKKNLK